MTANTLNIFNSPVLYPLMTGSYRTRIDQFRPVMVRNLFVQKRKTHLKYYLPMPSALTRKKIEEFETKEFTYKIEKSPNKTAFIIRVSFEHDYGLKAKILRQCKSYFIPIASTELGRLLPSDVKSCGIIIASYEVRIIVPVSQWNKRKLNSILVNEDIYNFNFKKKRQNVLDM